MRLALARRASVPQPPGRARGLLLFSKKKMFHNIEGLAQKKMANFVHSDFAVSFAKSPFGNAGLLDGL